MSLWPILVLADGRPPYEPKRFLSAKGTHRLDTRRTDDDRLVFELSKGDDIVARGEGLQLPVDVVVLEKEPAAVLFESYVQAGAGHALALLGADGKLEWQVVLRDLFEPEKIRRFISPPPGIHWWKAWWVHEKRGTVFLVSTEDDVRKVALADGKVVEGAMESLVEVLGEAAVAERRAVDVLVVLGEARALAGVMAHGKTGEEMRAYVAERLGKLPGERVLAGILEELEDADTRLAGDLLRAAIASRPGDLERRLQPFQTKLVEILKADAAPIDWLARYFKTNPTTEAVRPLLGKLARYAKNPTVKPLLLDALRACTGLDYGDDPARWLKALGG